MRRVSSLICCSSRDWLGENCSIPPTRLSGDTLRSARSDSGIWVWVDRVSVSVMGGRLEGLERGDALLHVGDVGAKAGVVGLLEQIDRRGGGDACRNLRAGDLVLATDFLQAAFDALDVALDVAGELGDVHEAGLGGRRASVLKDD